VANPTNAIEVVNQKERSVFKGATIATVNSRRNGTHNYLYVADFRQGKIEVFDTGFKRVFELEEEFTENDVPRGYAPFNVQNIGGNLYVAYAKQDGEKHDEEHGAGLGFVRVYSPSGEFLHRLDNGWFLNAPWGLVQAPSDFGPYSHAILVGNFGSGLIAVFDPITGEFKDVLRDAKSTPIAIDGLRALSFGDGTAGLATTLYFTAGTNHGSDGLFGALIALQNPQGNDQ
jgi:uncharacterized protein (TIGR03118 family)